LTCTSVYKKQTRKRVFSNVLTVDVYEARHSGDFKSEIKVDIVFIFLKRIKYKN